MAQPTSPEPGQTIKYLATIAVGEVTAVGAINNSWIVFELSIPGKWHPIGIELRLSQLRIHGCEFTQGR
jgi:hypothetical protein